MGRNVRAVAVVTAPDAAEWADLAARMATVRRSPADLRAGLGPVTR